MNANQRLAKLRLDRDQKGAEARGLGEVYADLREKRDSALLYLSSTSSRELAQFWRWGDPLSYLFDLPAETKARLASDIALAEQAQALAEQMAAVQARIAPLQADFAALSQLVRACEEYAREH